MYPLEKLKCLSFSLLLIALLSGLMACSSQGFNLKYLAKSDIDMVSDIVLLETQDQLKELLIKLYKRNPRELANVANMTVEKRLAMIYEQPGRLQFQELHGQEEIVAMDMAFSEDFHGDRVFALMVGLTGMLRYSYNYDADFYILEELDAQRLYNSARNIEVMAWKLKNKKNSQGKLYIVSSTRNGVIDNISFERIYGKLVQSQDIMAKIIVDKDNRTINTVVKGTLSIFLPI